jgi:hypothetical protein
MENYTIQTQQGRRRMKGWIGELRPNWPMFSLRLVISLVARLVIAGYGTARVFHLRAMHIATLNTPLTFLSSPRQSYLANIPVPYYGHSRAVANATASGADGRSEIVLSLPFGGLLRTWQLFKTTTATLFMRIAHRGPSIFGRSIVQMPTKCQLIHT